MCQNTINNGVAAVVNSEAITFREVLAQTQMEEDDLRAQQQAGKITDDERKQRIKSRRKTVLDSLIETRLIIQDYKRRDITFPTTISIGKRGHGCGISLAEIDRRW